MSFGAYSPVHTKEEKDESWDKEKKAAISNALRQYRKEEECPLIKIDGKYFDEFKEETEHIWAQLPGSVIGTLLYFLLVEINHENHATPSNFLMGLIIVGLPVYLTYAIQAIILYNLWATMPSMSADDDGSNLCGLPLSVEVAAVTVFYIVLIPSIVSVLKEAVIVFRCKFVAFKGDAEREGGKVGIHRIRQSTTKTLFTYLLVSAAEVVILLAMIFVGTQFILTSNGVSAVVVNSVAICFVMDIDNMAREAFQSEDVSEHIDKWEFETDLKAEPLAHVSKSKKTIHDTFKEESCWNHLLAIVQSPREFELDGLLELSSFGSSISALISGTAVVFTLQYLNC